MFENFTPEQVDALTLQGQLSAETAARLKEQLSAVVPPPAAATPGMSPAPWEMAPGVVDYPAPDIPQPAPPPFAPVSDSVPAPIADSEVAAPNPMPAPDAQPEQRSPDLYGDLGRAYQIQQDAVVEGAAAGMKQAAAEAGYARAMAAQQEQLAAEQAKQEELRQQQIAEQQKKVDSALADFSDEKVDSQRYWKNLSTGQKILAGIGVALAGFGAGLAGRGDNQALQIILKAIDNDIQEQRDNISVKKEKLETERGIFHDMRARFGDERSAELAARTVALNNSQLRLNAYAAASRSAQVQANAKLLYGQLEEEKVKTMSALLAKAAESPAFQAGQRKQVLGGNIDPATLSKEDRERYVPGLGFAQDQEERKKLIDAKTDFETINSLLDDISRTRTEKGTEFVNREVVTRQKSRAAQVKLKLKNLEKLGVLSESDNEILNDILPSDPTAYSASTAISETVFGKDPVLVSVDELRKNLATQFQNNMRARVVEQTPQTMLRTKELKNVQPGFAKQ